MFSTHNGMFKICMLPIDGIQIGLPNISFEFYCIFRFSYLYWSGHHWLSSIYFEFNLGFICICIFHINCISARGKSGRDCKVGLSSDGQCYYLQPRPSFFDERILMKIIDFHCVFVFVFHFCLLHRLCTEHCFK